MQNFIYKNQEDTIFSDHLWGILSYCKKPNAYSRLSNGLPNSIKTEIITTNIYKDCKKMFNGQRNFDYLNY